MHLRLLSTIGLAFLLFHLPTLNAAEPTPAPSWYEPMKQVNAELSCLRRIIGFNLDQIPAP